MDDDFGKSTGHLRLVSFSPLDKTRARPPTFVKASLAGTNSLGGGTSGRATVTPSPVGQSTASSSSSKVKVPIGVMAKSAARPQAAKRLPTYQEYLSLVDDLTHGRSAGITTPMASMAAKSMDPSSVKGTSQASTGATGAFADGHQRGADNKTATSVVGSEERPEVTANEQKDSSPPKSDWRMAIDLSSFRPYYYHTITNEVTWDKPSAETSGMDLDQGIWAEAADESTGRFYYHHTGTGQVTWVNPFAFAQQKSLKKLMKQISRSVPHGTLLGSDPFEPHVITPFRGISPVGASGKWKAKTSVLGKNQTIGEFKSAAAASMAYEVVRAALDRSKLPPNDPIRLDIFEAAKKEARNNALAMGCLEDSKPVALPFPLWTTAGSKRKIGADFKSDRVPKRVTPTNAPSLAMTTGLLHVGSRTDNSGIPKGVYQTKKSGNWCAQISVKGKARSISTFASPEEASHARAIVERAIGESGLSQQDEEVLEVFKTARDTARASSSVKVLPRGVSQASSGKFEARGPRTLGRSCYIGTFNTAGEAQSAVEAFENERQGIMNSNDEKELSLKIQAAKTKAKAAAIANAASHQRPSTAVVTLHSKRKIPSDISSERNKKKSGVPNKSHEFVSEQSKTTAASITYAQCCLPGCTRQGFPFSKGLCVRHYPRGPDGKVCKEIQRMANDCSAYDRGGHKKSGTPSV